MGPVVIDTNVLLVANEKHADASPECVLDCVDHLEEVQNGGVVVIDDAWRIVSEYQNKTQPNRPKGVGDVFLKWVLQNLGNAQRVQQVTLNDTPEGCYAEFPVPALQKRFDPPDRKFAAVANAHPDKPPVWQAADCKWLDWWPELQSAGVLVEFLCPDDVRRFYRKKFPENACPELPQKV